MIIFKFTIVEVLLWEWEGLQMKISITVEGHLKVFLHLFITNETAHILY